MTYAEAWNKIVGYYEKYGTDLEEKIQTVWEDSVFSAILNYNTTEIDAQRAVQMGSTKKADIVVRKDGKDVVVVELKRHTESVLGKGQDQLFSYLDRLKSAAIGILVCNKLYVYDYDFTKQDAENAENRLEIPFERDNPDGAKFVELFSKENFNAQNIKEYIQSQRQEKQDVSAIRGEITAELIKELLKKHFMQTYAEEAFEQAFSTVHIEVTDKATDVFEKHPTTAMVKTHECAEIRIKGHAFDLYMNPHHGDMIFQDFVQRTIADLLKWNLIPATEIEKLQKFDYSKETFGLQYALFQKDWKDCLDNTGKPRYWAKKINNMFYACSQWWKEKVVPIYEDKFADWLRYLSRICDNG